MLPFPHRLPREQPPRCQRYLSTCRPAMIPRPPWEDLSVTPCHLDGQVQRSLAGIPGTACSPASSPTTCPGHSMLWLLRALSPILPLSMLVMVTGFPEGNSHVGDLLGVLRRVEEKGRKQCRTEGEVKLHRSLDRTSDNISGSWEEGMALRSYPKWGTRIRLIPLSIVIGSYPGKWA